MDRRNIIATSSNENGILCDTLFYQGIGSSQTQILKYTDQKITATTGEVMWGTGRNNLPPLKVLYRPFIGKEIYDVNLSPFNSFGSKLNPYNHIASAITRAGNQDNGFHFIPANSAQAESVVFHVPNFTRFSLGQEMDMQSLREKYDSWLLKEDRTDGLILWAVSRGTPTTFCGFAKEKFPEVKLVVLEAAVDSMPNVAQSWAADIFKWESVSGPVAKAINDGFSFCNKLSLTQYRPDGPSPLKSVADFPEGVPVVFITSKIDKVVPCRNTENIARALANRGKNDVYLLKLENSSHPNYMFDDAKDRDCYEAFIHAIYKKYNLRHEPELAKKGEHLVESCMLAPERNDQDVRCLAATDHDFSSVPANADTQVRHQKM